MVYTHLLNRGGRGVRSPTDSLRAPRNYFQILFEESSEQEGHPYLLIQRQFETPDGGRCYIETENCDLAGHFRIRSARLGRRSLRLSWGRTSEEAVEVTFEADDSTFAEIGKVLRIMVPSAEVTV